eukprot:6226594-Alexandrium_andersonii.AAC.1
MSSKATFIETYNIIEEVETSWRKSRKEALRNDDGCCEDGEEDNDDDEDSDAEGKSGGAKGAKYET